MLEFLTADYTFVNERLARHYGIPDVYGNISGASRSPIRTGADCSARAAFCTVTSYPNRTSPVLRGKWMLDKSWARRHRRRRRTCRP